jgi:hypothetical protein
MEDALLAIFEKFTPAVRGYQQIGPKGNAIEILFDRVLVLLIAKPRQSKASHLTTPILKQSPHKA